MKVAVSIPVDGNRSVDGLKGEHGQLRTVHKLSADLLSIPDLLQEACVLGNTSNAEGVVLSAECVHQFIVGDSLSGDLTADLRVVCTT